jgi:hypothetical protein
MSDQQQPPTAREIIEGILYDHDHRPQHAWSSGDVALAVALREVLDRLDGLERRGCRRLASWRLTDGDGPDAYTLACDAHVGALRSATTTGATVISEEHPCCYLHPEERA